jgi:hypothetical protein
MKIFSLTLLATLSLGLSCFAQEGKLDKNPEANLNSPLYILNIKGKEFIFRNAIQTGSLMNQYQIKSMEVWKDSKTTARFGDKGKNGVIEITLTDSAKLINLKELLANFNIAKKDRKLPVYVDSTIVQYPKELILDPTSVKALTIATDTETQERYISIFSTTGRIKVTKGESRIRGAVNIRGLNTITKTK